MKRGHPAPVTVGGAVEAKVCGPRSHALGIASLIECTSGQPPLQLAASSEGGVQHWMHHEWGTSAHGKPPLTPVCGGMRRTSRKGGSSAHRHMQLVRL